MMKLIGNIKTDREISGNILSGGGEANRINSISVNGVNVPADAKKNVNISVPTAVSELTNNAGYQTAADVASVLASYATQAYVQEYVNSLDASEVAY